MRTLIVTHYFPPEIGAPQARLSELARCWAGAGDEVTVLTGMPNHPTGVIPAAYRHRWRMEEHLDGYRIVRTWLFATPNEGFVKKSLGHASFMVSSLVLGARRAGPADVVVVSSPTFLSIFSAWMLARLKRARLVVEVRDLWPAIFVELGVVRNRSVIRLLEMLELWAYGQADAVVVVTHGFRHDLVRRGVPEEKVHVIPNGVDLDRFAPVAVNDVGATRSHLGARPGDCLVLYLGAHGISHGLTSVADAAVMLAGQPVHIALVGEGSAKSDLARRVHELGLTNLTMRPGVARDEVTALLAAADICLVPLRDVALFSSFIPSKLFEYLGAGKAVIGSVRGEPAAILTDAGALVVEPEDPHALAQAIKELAGDPRRRAEMGRRGRAHMEAHFDRSAQGAQYRGILSGPAAPVPSTATAANGRADGMVAAQDAHFRERSETWSARYTSSPSFRARLEVVGTAIEAALSGVPGPARVLDYGGGTGVFSTIAARYSSFTLCVDRSPAMLAEGRRRFLDPGADAGARPGADLIPAASQIQWLAGDDRCLATGAPPFDLILAIAVLEYVPDVQGLLRRLAALLTPGGIMLLTVPNPRSTLRLAQRSGRRALAMSTRISASTRVADQSYLGLRPYGDDVPWRAAAAGAGLTITRIEPVPLGLDGLRRLIRPTLLALLRQAHDI